MECIACISGEMVYVGLQSAGEQYRCRVARTRISVFHEKLPMIAIEITELIICATVSDAAAAVSSVGDGTATPAGTPSGPDIIQECIEQVFKILDDKKQR